MRQPDWGPLYIETDYTRFPVEPWNTGSNIIFLALCIYCIYRTHLNYKRYPFVVFCLPFLITGTTGGILYHMTRSHPVWLFMDFLPIFLLCLFASVYLWSTILKELTPIKPVWLGGICIALTLLWLSSLMRGPATLRYMTLGANVSLPFLVYILMVDRERWYLVLSGIIAFVIAAFFRWFDQHGAIEYLPMGSHFLWHVFGGISTWLLFCYFLRLEEKKARGHEDGISSQPSSSASAARNQDC